MSELHDRLQERICERTTYFGIPALKNPLDAWVYQEIVFEVRPNVIVEIGNHEGGALLMYADLLAAFIHDGTDFVVIGVDRNPVTTELVRSHEMIDLVQGEAVDVAGQVAELICPSDRVLVIDDSSHAYRDTLDILRAYSPLVTPGSYFIVEDGIISTGVLSTIPIQDGPIRACKEFVEENDDFEIDRSREWDLTWNPYGFLRRKG